MAFELPDRWVWDSWVADDGDTFHLFYLTAPRSLGDPDLRHRNATIGHAVSRDLRAWDDRGTVLRPGAAGAFDETATWTGSVLRQEDHWLLFYTGALFLSPTAGTNIETIGLASSDDLATWQKQAGSTVAADRRWYETLEDGNWPEQAWRDPWVYRADDGWHMLITARSRPQENDPVDAGVVGHAVSQDLLSWEVQEPLSAPGAGFAHLEVLQPFTLGGRDFVLFSCDAANVRGERAAIGEGGVWVAPRDPQTGWCSIEQARLLVDSSIYAAHVIEARDGTSVLLGFENPSTGFGGRVSDPLPITVDDDGWPLLGRAHVAAV